MDSLATTGMDPICLVTQVIVDGADGITFFDGSREVFRQVLFTGDLAEICLLLIQIGKILLGNCMQGIGDSFFDRDLQDLFGRFVLIDGSVGKAIGKKRLGIPNTVFGGRCRHDHSDQIDIIFAGCGGQTEFGKAGRTGLKTCGIRIGFEQFIGVGQCKRSLSFLGRMGNIFLPDLAIVVDGWKTQDQLAA